MKQYIGKKVKIHIFKKIDLYYTAVVIAVTDSHITFVDKFQKEYCYKKSYVQEIGPIF